MINNKCERNSHRKKDIKDGIILSDDLNNIVIADNKSKSLNSKIHKTRKLTEISAKIVNRSDKGSTIKGLEDPKSKSFLKMSVKMNSYIDKIDFDNLTLDDITKSHYKTSYMEYETNGKTKIDRMSNSNTCSFCKKNGTKIVKCKANESEFQLSIKSKRQPCYRDRNKDFEFKCDEIYPGKFNQKNNCSLSLEIEKRMLKVDSLLLLQFLDRMRETVITRELSFQTFRLISERLCKDQMNIELLLLIDMIIRAQVQQMVTLIDKDLSHTNITASHFVASLLKQYQFLKSLSIVYKEMLYDYELTFLTAHKLSFDLINRAYFKRIVHECPRIKEQIVSGNVTVKLEQISNSTMPINERDRIKIDYASLKSDFQESDKWMDIEKTIQHILVAPNEIVDSLVTHSFSKANPCKKNSCDHLNEPVPSKCGDTYKDILETISNLPDRVSLTNPSSIQQHLLSAQNNNINHKSTQSNDTDKNARLTYGPIYQALENIKPPSISYTSSSNNSNGYNSCVSISSYEDSSEEDDNNGSDERLFQKWKRKCDVEQELNETCDSELRPTSLSFDDEQFHQSELEGFFSTQKRWESHDKDRSGNQDEIQQFDKLYEQYLAENEFLLDRTSAASSTTHMSVPDYLNTLEKADNLQSIIKILMSRYKKNIDIQEKISQHSNINFMETDNISTVDKQEVKIEEEDFAMDFDELSQTFGVESATRENLEEFERFLEGKLDINMGKTHPNLQALVSNCRLHCNKLYKPLKKERQTESDSSETGRNHYCGDSKQTVSGDESFDLPQDCSSTVTIEVDSNQDSCSNNNTSINNNMSSSSETGSNSASTENTNNSKVCNCCKCEMFGEQSLVSGNRTTGVRERLRNKLQMRKQCEQKSERNRISSFAQTNEVQVTDPKTLPDVDTLVEFINGDDKTGDVSPQTPVMVRSFLRKNTPKTNKTKLKKTNVTSTINDEINKSTIIKVNGEKEFNFKLRPGYMNVREYFSEPVFEIANSEERIDVLVAENESYDLDNEVPEQEIYDPVVEEFKRFCNNVVVPKHRKKLLFGPSLLLDELEKREMESNINARVSPSV